MSYNEETIERNYVYEGKIIKVRVDKVKLHGGRISKREVVEHNGGVGIVALTDNNELIMVKQFRKPFESEILEIPAGKLEEKESPLDCGTRELEEETGFKPKEMKFLGEIYPSPGFSKEVLYLYFTKNMEKGKVHLDEGEFIDVEYIKFDEAKDMIYNGKIKDAKTIAGILMAEKYI